MKRESLDEAGRQVYDTVAGDARRPTALQGPGGIRLYSPRLAEAVRKVSDYLRFESGLGDRLVEVTILVAARELGQQFVWAAHEPAALRAGVPVATVNAIRNRGSLAGVDEREAVLINLGREAIGARRVRLTTYAAALRQFGEKGLVDLVSLMGEYAATAVLLDTFDQQLPAGQQALLPVR